MLISFFGVGGSLYLRTCTYLVRGGKAQGMVISRGELINDGYVSLIGNLRSRVG